MDVQIDRDIGRAFAQLYEIQRRLLNGALSPLAIRSPLQEIIEGRQIGGAETDTHARFLLSLEDQLSRLRHFNVAVWKGRLTDEQLDAVDTSSTHVQRVDDLEILHVDFGKLQDTLLMWWEVLSRSHYRHVSNIDSVFDSGPRHLRLAPGSQSYKPGIHRVRVNLSAYYNRGDLSTIQEVRDQAEAAGELLCSTEPLSAYGLHRELVRQRYGATLSYAHMAGLEFKPYRELLAGKSDWRSALALIYHRDRCEIDLTSVPVDYPRNGRAIPTVVRL